MEISERSYEKDFKPLEKEYWREIMILKQNSLEKYEIACGINYVQRIDLEARVKNGMRYKNINKHNPSGTRWRIREQIEMILEYIRKSYGNPAYYKRNLMYDYMKDFKAITKWHASCWYSVKNIDSIIDSYMPERFRVDAKEFIIDEFVYNALVDKLTPRQKEVVNLRRKENMSVTKIAEKLGVGRANVYSILVKASRKIGWWCNAYRTKSTICLRLTISYYQKVEKNEYLYWLKEDEKEW